MSHDGSHRLERSPNGLIAGVCAGIAEFLGWSPAVVRIGYVLVSVLSAAFPGILVYIVLWFVMPRRSPVVSGV
jgi:phage shock protein PspC (stress-responsive transcriptional regulator)